MSNLKSLDISYNKLTLIDEGIFQYLSQLELLFANNNLIVNMPTKAVFNKMTSLQQLRLDSNKLFVSSVVSNTSTIDFSNCPFASLNNLTYLSLSNNSAYTSTTTTTTTTNINILGSRILAACAFR